MPKDARRLIRLALLFIAVCTLVGYSIFEARFLIQGPVISVDTPTNGATVTSSLIIIAGTAKNITDISLNDRKIFVDEKGNFSEQLLLAYGYNILTLKANDRFGRETKQVLE